MWRPFVYGSLQWSEEDVRRPLKERSPKRFTRAGLVVLAPSSVIEVTESEPDDAGTVRAKVYTRSLMYDVSGEYVVDMTLGEFTSWLNGAGS